MRVPEYIVTVMFFINLNQLSSTQRVQNFLIPPHFSYSLIKQTTP